MSGFSIGPSQYGKVRGAVDLEPSLDRVEVVEAIIKVSEPGYTPPDVKVRSRIDSMMFTGETRTDVLEALEHDPKVESVSVGQRLRVIE